MKRWRMADGAWEVDADVLAHGVECDPLLAMAPDRPVFGLNVACAWPFPDPVRAAYACWAESLAQVPGLHVYRPSDTHITLVTLISFLRHQDPSPVLRAELESLAAAAIDLVRRVWNELGPVRPFALAPEPPLLTRRVCLLPWSNATGEVAALRAALAHRLKDHAPLAAALRACGFNIPNIIHSTVGRFVPADSPTSRVVDAFARSRDRFALPPLEVREWLVTAELKPYMRAGEVRARHPLAGP